jgi:four helix bundle protein
MAERRSYRDLEIWQIGMDLAERIYQVTRDFPSQEVYGLTGQLRRAAASVPVNIAEGYGRGSKAALANFVRISRGSLSEVETLIELARRLGYVSEETQSELLKLTDPLGRKTYMFIKSLDVPVVKETAAVYGVSEDPIDQQDDLE